MSHQKLLKLALCCAILTTGTALLADTDTSQALLDLLVKKGIVTPEEAQQLRSEAAANAAASNPAPAAQPAQPSSGAAPAAPEAPAPSGPGFVGSPANTPVAGNQSAAPLSFNIGIAKFSPVGFMDFTTVYRGALTNGDIGTSFGGIPYSNTQADQLSETRFSAKNSRLGLRVDSQVGPTKVLGYVEADFLGNAAANLNVTSNSDTLRMRVYFVDLQQYGWEFLAGQDWSLLTPNRKGLSPMPSDVFYSQDMDTNYQVGLVWSRQPQLRVVYHPDDNFALGISAENPDQYIGSAITLPSTFTNSPAQLDNGSNAGGNGTAIPQTIPDLIVKAAYDDKLAPGMPFHIEAAGLYREFKINSFSAASGLNENATASGVGGSINSSLGILPGLTLFENAFFSDGGARYISTGLGPDVIVTPADASGAFGLSPLHASSGLGGLEWDITPMTKLYGYYGTARFQANYVQLANGSYVGYGYPGSPNSQNRQIDEYTGGVIQTLWKNPSYGDLKIITQLSYLDRDPFYVAPGAPSDAHVPMVWADLRYDLP